MTFYQMDAEGREVRSVPLGFTRPCMTHDFFITERFAVFLEGSLYMAPEVGARENAMIVGKHKKSGLR